MKLTYKTSELREALSECFAVANPRSPKETIKNVYLGGGFMRATDMEVSLSIQMETGDVEMLLPPIAKEIAASASGEEISLSVGEKTICIGSGLDRWEVPISDPSEFPQFQPIKAAGAKVPAAVLRAAMARCIPLADEASAQYAMAATLFEEKHVVGGSCRAICATKTDFTFPKCLVPPKAGKVLLRLLADAAECEVSANENSVKFEIAGKVLQTRQTDGRWPQWQKVLGKPEFRVTVSPTELLSGFRKARVSCLAESRGVSVRTDGAAGQLKLQADTEAGGSLAIVPVISCDDGERCETFDWQLPSAFLASISDLPSVTLGFCGSGEQVQMQTEDGSICVIMPLARS